MARVGAGAVAAGGALGAVVLPLKPRRSFDAHVDEREHHAVEKIAGVGGISGLIRLAAG